MLRPAALILVAVLCVGLGACRQSPNIVLILTDDQSNYDAKGARVIAPGQRAALTVRGGGAGIHPGGQSTSADLADVALVGLLGRL